MTACRDHPTRANRDRHDPASSTSNRPAVSRTVRSDESRHDTGDTGDADLSAAGSRRLTLRVHDERGVAAVWTMIVVTTAFIGLMALVGGGGELINERVEAKRAAEQAARAGADELSASAVRSGTDQVDAGKAIARASALLRQAGWSGSARVEGSRVVVTVSDTRTPQFLRLIGVGAMRINETGSADAISTPDG